MHLKYLKPALPALILPFLAVTPGLAQANMGTSHPEELPDSTVQTDHYVKPSHAGSAPVAPAAVAPAPPAYQNSFPATGPAPEPVLLPRQPALAAAPVVPPASSQYAPYAESASVVREQPLPADADDGIVLQVPVRPHELNRGTLLHTRIREALNTQTTPEGAVFTAELLADAGHSGEVMLPAGSLIRGHVTSVHGGKRITGGAAIHLRPETISLPDGTLYRLDAQVTDLNSTQDLRVNDEGTIVLRSNPKAAAAVVGGITGTAAVTGAVLGGGVGAAVGAVAGASIATVVYLKREVQEIIPSGTDVIFALEQPFVATPR